MPSLPESILCTSWLVYATRATDEPARRTKNLILQIKTDRVDAATGTPVVRIVIERIVPRLDDDARAFFAGFSRASRRPADYLWSTTW